MRTGPSGEDVAMIDDAGDAIVREDGSTVSRGHVDAVRADARAEADAMMAEEQTEPAQQPATRRRDAD
jgi:hypothetical protein